MMSRVHPIARCSCVMIQQLIAINPIVQAESSCQDAVQSPRTQKIAVDQRECLTREHNWV